MIHRNEGGGPFLMDASLTTISIHAADNQQQQLLMSVSEYIKPVTHPTSPCHCPSASSNGVDDDDNHNRSSKMIVQQMMSEGGRGRMAAGGKSG